MHWAVQDEYILEAGLNNDVELPYTCRGGICGYVAALFLPTSTFQTQFMPACVSTGKIKDSAFQYDISPGGDAEQRGSYLNGMLTIFFFAGLVWGVFVKGRLTCQM